MGRKELMPMALLILGTAGMFSLRAAVKMTPHPPKLVKAVTDKSRVPKLMGMLVLGMQAGEVAHRQDPLSIVTLFAAAFAAGIAGAMVMRSGAEAKYRMQ